MRRVVITGIGAVTPVGGNAPSTWESICAGRHGFSKIDRFGLDNQLPHREFVTPDKDTVLRWVDTVRRYGGRLVNED